MLKEEITAAAEGRARAQVRATVLLDYLHYSVQLADGDYIQAREQGRAHRTAGCRFNMLLQISHAEREAMKSRPVVKNS